MCTYQPLPALSVSQDYTVCLRSLWPRALTLSFWLRDDEGKKGNKLSRENSFRSVSGPTFTDLGRDVLCVVCSTEIKKQPAVGATGKKSPFHFMTLSFSDFLLVSSVARERGKREGEGRRQAKISKALGFPRPRSLQELLLLTSFTTGFFHAVITNRKSD